MLTGEPVFTGSTTQALLARHLHDQPRSIRVVRPEVPPEVEAAILASLAKDRDERPASAGELAARLA